jgi:hypothetical protein
MATPLFWLYVIYLASINSGLYGALFCVLYDSTLLTYTNTNQVSYEKMPQLLEKAGRLIIMCLTMRSTIRVGCTLMKNTRFNLLVSLSGRLTDDIIWDRTETRYAQTAARSHNILFASPA